MSPSLHRADPQAGHGSDEVTRYRITEAIEAIDPKLKNRAELLVNYLSSNQLDVLEAMLEAIHETTYEEAISLGRSIGFQEGAASDES